PFETAIRQFDPFTGIVLNTFNLPLGSGAASARGTPIVSDDVIFFGTWNGFVFAVNATTFSQLWMQNLLPANGVSAPVTEVGDWIVFGTFSGAIYQLAKADGSIVSMYQVPGVTPYTGGIIYGIQTAVIATPALLVFFTTSMPTENFIAVDLTVPIQM